MKIKRIIYTTLLILWMIVIFLFSNQNATNSQSTSDKVASTIVDTAEVVTKQEIPKEDKENFIENTRVLIRKSAHFMLYFVLGILTYLTFTSYSISKTVLFSIIFCFLYACSDEIHQMFLDGRAARILDVCIDTCGSSIAIWLCYFVKRLKNIKVNSVKV